MAKKDPYHVIKHQHVTEKSMMLQNLKNATSNVSLKRCESPKYVFIVDNKANKQEIAVALEEIYIEKNIKVVDVNTINVKPKARRVRGRLGNTSAFKKAVVTLQKGDSLDNV
jgi:large subunit ribosomal protein L23